MLLKVTRIIDGDTFEVSPKWNWNGHPGNIVRPVGYDAPEKGEAGFQKAKDKLADLILDKEVELKNPKALSYGRLVCEVYVDGLNLAAFFPEYGC